jgi:DHA2 family multidrug resistance protein
LLGKLRIDRITRADVERMRDAVTAGKTAEKIDPGEKRPSGTLTKGGKGAAAQCVISVSDRRALLAGVPVYILLARRFDLRWLMMFGLALFGLSMWSFSYITSQWSGGELLVPQILRGFPQVFAVAPAVTLGLGSLPPERLKYASGLFDMMRNLGGAFGIATCGAILNARTNFHFDAIAYLLTPANGPMDRLLAGLAARYGAIPGSLDDGRIAALKELWRLAYREAATLAYADAFRAIMLAFIVATLLAPLLRQVAPPKTPPQAAH